MDIYALLKAVSNYDPQNLPVKLSRCWAGTLRFQVTSFGRNWSFQIRAGEITAQYEGGSQPPFTESELKYYHLPSTVNDPLLLNVVWMLIHEAWPTCYQTIVDEVPLIGEYNNQTLETLLKFHVINNRMYSIYLPTILFLTQEKVNADDFKSTFQCMQYGRPYSFTLESHCGNLALYNEDDDELVDWGQDARMLWRHLIKMHNKEDEEDEDEEDEEDEAEEEAESGL
jgi:hypothetical protein